MNISLGIPTEWTGLTFPFWLFWRQIFWHTFNKNLHEARILQASLLLEFVPLFDSAQTSDLILDHSST